MNDIPEGLELLGNNAYDNKPPRNTIKSSENSDEIPEGLEIIASSRNQPSEKSSYSYNGNEITRILKGLGIRGAEAVAGLPGDVTNLAAAGLGYVAPKIQNALGIEPGKANEMRSSAVPVFGTPQGSEDFREFTKSITGETFEPKSKGEEIAQEIASDFASLAVPIGGEIRGGAGLLKNAGKLVRPMLTAIGANAAKGVSGLLGVGEKGQAYTKLGAMLTLSLLGRKTPQKLANEFYDKADKALPKGTKIPAGEIVKQIDELETTLLEGGTSPSNKEVLQKIKELKGKVEGGKINAKSLHEFKKSVNEIYPDLNAPKEVRRKLARNIDKFRAVLKNNIKSYGKENPEYVNNILKGDEIYGAIAQSKKVQDSIKNVLKRYPYQSSALAALFGFSSHVTLSAASQAALPAIAGVKAFEIVTKALKSPDIRKLYMQTINSAIKENPAVMMKNLQRLDKKLKAMESED
jgi:hypothetical protein